MSEPWNHNLHYHDVLLAAVPRPCRRALDVGCGFGVFARRLAERADDVLAIDRQPEVLRRARELSAGIANLRFEHADFLTRTDEAQYDFISMIAVLHHLPLAEGLDRAARALAPNGTLAILGLYRSSSPLDFAQSCLAFPVSRWFQWTRGVHTIASPINPPIRDPRETLAEIRRVAAERLPGAALERHLLWRYSLIWRKSVETRLSGSLGGVPGA